MTVDLSKIKPGDEVAVRAVVIEVCGSSIRVRPESFVGAAAEQWTGAIVSHTPKALAAGDRVSWIHHTRHTEERLSGELLATYDDLAWVAQDHAPSPITLRLAMLERAQ